MRSDFSLSKGCLLNVETCAEKIDVLSLALHVTYLS